MLKNFFLQDLNMKVLGYVLSLIADPGVMS